MSAFTKGVKNAAVIGDALSDGKIIAGVASFGASSTTDAITHGLGSAPTFVLATRSEQTSGLTWTANTTAVTFTRAGSTSGAETFTYVIGVVA